MQRKALDQSAVFGQKRDYIQSAVLVQIQAYN